MKTHITLFSIVFLLLCSTMTMAQTVFRGTVIDSETKQPIAEARVGISNQGVGEITNTKGFFNYRKYHEVLTSDSKLVVGATGYESVHLDAEKVRTLFNRSSKIELQPTSKKQKQTQVKDLVVFWDVSEDMQGRDIEAEVRYVQNYVSAYKELKLRLVVFDYKVRSEELITIRNGDISRFRESVNSLIYNGPSNYDVLDIATADAVILSSNGNPNYGTLKVSQEVPVSAIASKNIDVEVDYMRSLASYTQGRFSLLQAYTGQVSTTKETAQKSQVSMIRGRVESLGKPLQEVSISKKGDLTEYFTKADGSFELPARDGDVLQFRYLGMFPKVVLVENVEDLKIELMPRNDVLDEVILTEKYEDIIVGNKVIKGTNEPHIPGGITKLGDFYITNKDIVPNGKTLEVVLREKFSGVTVSYTAYGEVVTIFGKAPVWIVNGFALNPGEPAPLYILDSEIASIIVKDSDMTNLKYGGQGEAGLQVIVTTKRGREEFKNEKEYLAKNNDFNETLEDINSSSVINSKTQIAGKVISLGKPIQGVTITKKGSFDEVTSASDGSFKIFANKGDVLVFKYLGMYSKLAVVEDSSKIIEIELLPKNDVLDEVVIKGKAKTVIPEVAGPILERGQYKLGNAIYNVTTLTRDDFNFDHFKDLVDGLNGKLAGVTKGNGGVLVRGETPFYFIDGQLVDALQFENLNPIIVESISVKRSLGNVEGFTGRAIFINTKQFIDPSLKQPSPLVKGNDYAEEIPTIENGIVDTKTQIAGKIISLGKPIQGATIIKKGTFEEYTSKADGSFKALANEGDQLIVSYLGMYPTGFVVDDKTSYRINLVPKNDVLDEVVLNGENKSDELKKIEAIDEEYKRKSYSPRVLTKDEIAKSNSHDLIDLIAGKFSGTEAKGISPNLVLVNPRSATNAPFGVLLDGVLYDQEILDFINMDIITKVEVINSGFTSAAGQGEGGVIKITTIPYDTSYLAKKETPSALVEGNDYAEEEVKSLSDPLLGSSSKVLVSGVVRSPKGFLEDATITRKGSFDEVYTDAQGAFKIKASLGDVLVVSKAGMFAKEVLIETQDVGSIELTPKNDELDEVIVSGDKRVDNTIEGNDGRRVDKDKLGYAASELTENDFAAGATNLRQLITGKVSGVSVEGGLYSGSDVVYKIRGGNQSIENEIPPIWIVNGTPYQDPPNFLDVQQIASITVLKSVVATSRYGTLAAGGAFLIKTKEVSFQDKAKKAQKSALVSGNEYTESSTRTLDTSTLPEYILRLREIPNIEDRFEKYQRISRTQESPLEFYVDVAQYFDGINSKMADQVRADLAYISRNNTKALRTLCYIYEAAGDYEKAALVYERILKIAPSEAQSYRDLALVYQEIGKYNEALELYYNMLGEQIKGVDFTGLEKTLRNELSHLLALHKDKVDYSRFPNEWLRTDFDIDIRMVIDWSDRSVPFEFQFVNPDKKFFKWTHTLQENRDRLEGEQAQGYQSEEFIIDDAPSGEWLINIQYLGDEGDYVLPPFLKYTVYRNYGTPKETKEIKVVKLFKQSDKVTLGKVAL
ncbi:TonB-dependent receptor plug domain-containing protein [uncultured Dokdonia sp.]|uniref:TonB-dependent receptor plug domain-containing protein n=3 Tax=uncultured Dokdonia sp. TaxID=575653 RepID=UPI00261409B6|nr:TonB-dependent receptor plug domain-containing protein [uncultured Dokdonia sp.]